MADKYIQNNLKWFLTHLWATSHGLDMEVKSGVWMHHVCVTAVKTEVRVQGERLG